MPTQLGTQRILRNVDTLIQNLQKRHNKHLTKEDIGTLVTILETEYTADTYARGVLPKKMFEVFQHLYALNGHAHLTVQELMAQYNTKTPSSIPAYIKRVERMLYHPSNLRKLEHYTE